MLRKVSYPILFLFWGLLMTMADSFADVVVAEQRVHEAVEAYVLELLSDFGGEIEVDVRKRGDIQIDGTGSVTLSVRGASSRGNARTVPLILEVRRGPAIVKTYPVTANVRYFDDVLVSTRPIERGEPLASEAVTLERRDVTSILGRYLSDPDALAGRQARMRIAFGRALDPRYLETIPAVNRGDLVQIRVSYGGIMASTQGVATQSGAAGDHIVVQNVESREKLLAEIVAPGVVTVRFQ